MQSPSLVQAIAQARGKRLKPHVVPMSLAVVLSLTSGGLVMQTIAPPAVHAYTGTVNVTIDVQPSETYDTLIRRAEAIARAATQRSFDRDILMTDVAIVVIAQNAASTVPVLSLATTRSQWRSQPDPRRWATYYSTSKALLGLDKAPTATTTVTQPTVTNVPPTTPTATPTSTAAPTSTAPTSTQPRSTPPNTPTTPTNASGGATTGSPQTPATTSPSLIPQRIPTPANIGK